MSTYKLTYLDCPARGEVARLLFTLADQEFEDIRITTEQWAALKLTTPFGQLPVLEVDGVKLVQSQGINMLLAKRFGYGGKTDIETAQIMMVAGCMEDIQAVSRPLKIELDPARREVLKKELTPKVMDLLMKLEQMLINNNGGDGYFIGNELSLADIHFYARLEFPTRGGIKMDWNKIPKLTSLYDKVANEPKIKAWNLKTKSLDSYYTELEKKNLRECRRDYLD